MPDIINICNASPEDAEDIFQLIVQLAVYEKEPNAVKATAAELHTQLSSASPPFHCLLAKVNGRSVGFALYFFSYSTWRAKACLYLEDLFVLEAHRSTGVGYRLMIELAKIASKKDCPRIEWSVLNWNQLAIQARFYCLSAANPISSNNWHRA